MRSIVIVAAGILLAGCSSATAPQTSPGSASSQGSNPSASSAQSPVGQETLPPGDIPDTQAFVSVTAPGGYSVKVPEGWAKTTVGASIVYTSVFNSIKLDSKAAAVAPTEGSARSDEIPSVVAGGGSVSIGTVSTVSRPGGSAILITYQSDSPPDAVTGKTGRLAVERYEFWHQGTEAVITLSSPIGSDNVDPWKTVTSSVQW